MRSWRTELVRLRYANQRNALKARLRMVWFEPRFDQRRWPLSSVVRTLKARLIRK